MIVTARDFDNHQPFSDLNSLNGDDLVRHIDMNLDAVTLGDDSARNIGMGLDVFRYIYKINIIYKLTFSWESKI